VVSASEEGSNWWQWIFNYGS